MRKGPSTDNVIVLTMPNGSRVKVIDDIIYKRKC